MNKQTIAVDIDDVIADNATAFIAFSNSHWGTDLAIEDYTEHFAELWQVDSAEAARRSDDYHAHRVHATYAHKQEARPVLTELAKRYRLIIITSRRSLIKDLTVEWVDKYYRGIFEDIHFSGFYDGDSRYGGHKLSKGELLVQHQADFLIDDQPGHCSSAMECGLPAVLFGDYPWNRSVDLPKGVTRCQDWQAVKEFFDARS